MWDGKLFQAVGPATNHDCQDEVWYEGQPRSPQAAEQTAAQVGITGAVLGWQNTSFEQLTSQYGHQ